LGIDTLQYICYRNPNYGNPNYDKVKFYIREQELTLLRDLEKRSHQVAQMAFELGRRRIGKASLLVKAYQQSTSLYFFVAKQQKY